ncbi:hypothetical protein AAFN85_23115 [Mucilaginibacter sp. CAU 1740]|uniref:hypothetical protein n=1 Tax=Mucilaginibacter sp. CAU 1740 TaxID=3140365 RepID=UPI00325B641D
MAKRLDEVLAQMNIHTDGCMQMPGSYIKPNLLKAVFDAITFADHQELINDIKPLQEIKMKHLK